MNKRTVNKRINFTNNRGFVRICIEQRRLRHQYILRLLVLRQPRISSINTTTFNKAVVTNENFGTALAETIGKNRYLIRFKEGGMKRIPADTHAQR